MTKGRDIVCRDMSLQVLVATAETRLRDICVGGCWQARRLSDQIYQGQRVVIVIGHACGSCCACGPVSMYGVFFPVSLLVDYR